MAGTKLAATYIGKWLTVTGTVKDVSGGGSVAYVSFVQGKIAVHMTFGQPLTDTVSALQKGDSITVRGQIYVVQNTYVSIEKCELIKF